MATFDTVALSIIKEQALVIGPLAWDEAKKVKGLKIADSSAGHIEFDDPDQKQVIDRLVAQYERLFGPASHEVCKEAAAKLVAGMPAAEIPTSLR